MRPLQKTQTPTAAKLFSTLDLKSGYWQIPVAPEYRYKTTFTCDSGPLEFKRMPYELANASASSNAPWTGATWTDQCCFVSIDDMIIYSRNAVEHIYHLRLVSERLSEAGMKIKPDYSKQYSMKYSSESEDSEHNLARSVVQYIYYIFSILVSSLHTVEVYIRHIRAEFYSIFFFFFFLLL